MIKGSREAGAKRFPSLVLKTWKTRTWTKDWKRPAFVITPHKGDLKECTHPRSVSLISRASKIWLKIIAKRLKQKLEEEIKRTLARFRKEEGYIQPQTHHRKNAKKNNNLHISVNNLARYELR